MVQCVDRSAKRDFHRDGILFVFYTVLPQVILSDIATNMCDKEPGDETGMHIAYYCLLCAYIIMCTHTRNTHAWTHMRAHTHIPLATSPTKKRRVQKKSRAEGQWRRLWSRLWHSSVKRRRGNEKNEEERWQNKTELEEKRRREDQEHEMRMMRMLGQMFRVTATTGSTNLMIYHHSMIVMINYHIHLWHYVLLNCYCYTCTYI